VDEALFLLKNESFPIFQNSDEPDPADATFVWESLREKNPTVALELAKEKQKANRDLVNFSCRLCPEKVSGIRGFLQRGRKPILVLHYSGATSPKEKSFVKKHPKQIFKDLAVESTWALLIQKAFSVSHEELYYQEYPACNFPTKSTQDSTWKPRLEACKLHIAETILENHIQFIFILGSSAKLLYGNGAKEKVGVLDHLEIGGQTIPTMVIRSPEALVVLSDKAKTLFSYAEERQELEKTMISQLQESLRFT